MLYHKAELEWKQKPVITTIETFAKPISLAQFPTTTVCMGQNAPLDYWGPVEKLLDPLPFQCDPAVEVNCTEGTKALEYFAPFIDGVFFALTKKLSGRWSQELNFDNYFTGYHNKLQKFKQNIFKPIPRYLVRLQRCHFSLNYQCP